MSVDSPKSKIQNPEFALLVLVHGTPRPASNAPMWQVVEEIRSRNIYPIVEVGFMECNDPDIPTAIKACIDNGATQVIAVPYFLHTGKHVADDLPTAIEEAQLRYPEIEFLMGDFLGRAPEMTDLLAKRAAEARRTE
jgi:sirohydrochlorin ferrochelatase